MLAMSCDDHTPIALFLDFDGTLVEFAPRPNEVRLAPDTLRLITTMRHKLGGALAVISGRTVENLSYFLSVRGLALAGLHGLQIQGELPLEQPEFPEVARQDLINFSLQNPEITLEDKGVSMALHYRLVPHLGDRCMALAARIAEETHGAYSVLAGNHVAELRPSDANKGRAIAAFMQQPPFFGRIPVFIGDDVTDEDGFTYVNRHDGISIKVGTRHHTAAKMAIPDVTRTLDFIQLLCSAPDVTVATIWETYETITAPLQEK